MQKRQVLFNAIMSIVQVVIIGGVLFILYRFLLKTIGVKQLGIWSLVLATTSVTQIANLGLSGGVVKFVAKYVARDEHKNVSAVIQTASLSIAAFIGLVLLVGYPVIKWILGLVVAQESLPAALSILPFALFSLWLLAITSIFQSGLDGYQRIDLRSMLLMTGATIHLCFCFMLAPTYGLTGVAYSSIIQNFSVFIISWVFLKRQSPFLPIVPYQWDKSFFKEIVTYGINFQLISVSTMFYDPITKALLSKFGGLSMVGFYEMANKMVQQFRALIVSANQVLVPAIANLQEKNPEKIKEVYLTCYHLTFYLAIPLFSLIIVSTPLISKLWIGRYESIFVFFGILLSIGWLLNTLSVPAYFVYLGIGELRWNLIGHITIALLNALLGFLLGTFYDGFGVAIGWIISLTFGSSLIYLSYHNKHQIPFSELLPQTSRMLFIICLIGIASVLIMRYKLSHLFNSIILNNLIVFSFLIIIIAPLWLHPMRTRLIRWVINEVLDTKQ